MAGGVVIDTRALVPVPANGGTGLVSAKGTPLAPTASYLQQQAAAERAAGLQKAWDWYTGNIRGQARPEVGQPDVNVIANRVSAVIDTGVDFLYGKPVSFVVTLNGKAQKDAQKALDACWGKEDRRMVILAKLAQNGGVFGHSFAKLLPPAPGQGRKYCRIVVLDPAQVSVITDPDDCENVTAYIIDWNISDPRFKQISVQRRQVIMRLDPEPDPEDDYYARGASLESTWEISDWLRGPNNSWYQIGEPIDWPHPWAPIVDWQNLPLANSHWGQSDAPANVQHLNSVLNRVLTDINAISKHHAFPWMFASNVPPGTMLDIGPGKVTQFHSGDGKLSAVEAHGDLAGLLAVAQDLRGDMDEQTRVPAIATGRFKELPRVTSGVALQMLYGPLLAKTTHKRRTYGSGHEALSLRMLALCGFGDGTGEDGWEVQTEWDDPLPSDDAALAQIATAMDSIGASQHSTLQRLGLDYDEEREYKAQEARDALADMAKGAGLPALPPPSPVPGTPTDPSSNPAGASGAAPQAAPIPPSNTPPVNHPAAVAARAGAKAVGAAMKAAAKQ